MSTIIEERQSLIRAIADNYDDFTPRLILADWLEEYGESESDIAYAEFIRDSLENHPVFRDDLLQKYQKEWFPLLGRNATNKYRTEALLYQKEDPGSRRLRNNVIGIVEKGTIERVTIYTQDWLTVGPEIIREYPINYVTLTDRVYDTGGITETDGENEYRYSFRTCNQWLMREAFYIPPIIFSYMEKSDVPKVVSDRYSKYKKISYLSNMAGARDMSDACLKYARDINRNRW